MLALGFHRIERFTGFEITRLSPTRFDRILTLIDGADTRVVCPGEEHGVVLTFDDGLASVAETALPLLSKRGWPAMIFLVAGFVGETDSWDVRLLGRGRPMMSWGEVQQWSRAGVSFGSHTVTHADLTALSVRALREELRGSKAMIEDQTGVRVDWLSYPFGRHDERVREEAAEAGYAGAFGTHVSGGGGQDRYARPRVLVNSLTSLLELRSLLRTSEQMALAHENWRGHWRNRFLSSLSVGSATVSTWRRLRHQPTGKTQRRASEPTLVIPRD